MIEILKKRFTVGDNITIRTLDGQYEGKIDSFEENCIVLNMSDGSQEFILNDSIKSAKAHQGTSKQLVPEISNNNLPNKKDEPVADNNKLESVDKRPRLKVIGYIDPKEFDKQEKREAKKNSKFSNTKPKKIFSSLSDLQQLVLPALEEENKKLVPANGIIKTYFADRNFGFIVDKYGYEVWFSFNSILDDELLNILRGKSFNANIPILFTLTKNYKGDTAVNIHKPKTVLEIINLAQKYLEEKKYDTALSLVENIIEAFPENISASNLKKTIETNRFKKTTIRPKVRAIERYYPKAKELATNKNYTESLRLYLLALENNERRETCIKDIAMLYVSMGEPDKALDFMEKYENELASNITTYNYLENFYSSAKQFIKVIKYIDLLLSKTKVTDRRKYSMYLSKKGFAYIQLKELEKAKDILEEAVSIQPENTYASRLLKALIEPNSEELTQVIAEAEFDSFGGGFSKYIIDTLENYEDYFGIPPKIIDTGDFTPETLNSIRKLIETAGKARPRERANYLLTEAKLMQTIEPERDINLRSVLARYCNAMALNHISENSSMDVIRSFYLEAFSLEEKYQLTAPQVALYLISFKSSYSELIATKTPSIDEALEFILEKETREAIWEGILSLFLWNRSISAQLISKLFYKSNFKLQSLNFLKSIGITYSDIKSIDEYTLLWNQAREKRQRDYSKWLAAIKSVYINNELETLTSQLFEVLSNARQPWLTQLDNHRLNTISTEIFDILNEYHRQSSFDDKERSYNFAKAQINQLINEIKEKPTKFSYEGFLPLLEQINLLIEKSFNKVLEASTPKVNINILREASAVSAGNIVPFQLSISNSNDSSPIREVSIKIQENENVTFIEENNIYYDSVKGGADCILKLSVKVSNKVIEDKATTLEVTCQYKTRNAEQPFEIKRQIALRLYSEDDFESIQNPYAPVADGGPVEDKKMFYGRDEFIETVSQSLLDADSKQVIIYGQKRSGKSSVLYHLKKKLEESNKTFCVLFSLGDIIENLTSATFYYKILSSIEEELENHKLKNNSCPNYICPDFKEFQEHPNPSDLFRKQMISFKRICQYTNGWDDKKIIIMIDEFTYLYTAIRKGTTSDTIMKQWKAVTQNENAKFSVVLIGQDVVPTFKNEEYAKNAFGVIQDIRLTYLSKEDARKLIEEPCWDLETNSNRFIGRAIDTIIDYTSCNPYYIQIFCSRLIDFMNRKKIPKATEADIRDVAYSFTNGEQALTADKFDNLLKAGEKYDFQEIPTENSVKILRMIANGSKNIGYCPREYISFNNVEYEEKILKDLTNREVLVKKENNYKIQVKLFQEWLLNH